MKANLTPISRGMNYEDMEIGHNGCHSVVKKGGKSFSVKWMILELIMLNEE